MELFRPPSPVAHGNRKIMPVEKHSLSGKKKPCIYKVAKKSDLEKGNRPSAMRWQ